jgi:hypothetical protein
MPLIFRAIHANFDRWRSGWNSVLIKVAVILPRRTRRWHQLLVDRLLRAGYDVSIATGQGTTWPATMDLALALERKVLRRGTSLSAPTDIPTRTSVGGPDLCIALADDPGPTFSPTLRIAFDGGDDHAAVAALADGRLPNIEVLLDGQLFEQAAPMVDNRVFVAAGTDDVLARAVTLLVKAVRRVAAGDRQTFASQPAVAKRTGFATSYVGRALPGLAREVVRRSRYRFAHWRVGYRFIDGPGVAETGALGSGWSVLPDDGSHFYADPFPLEHGGKHFIFVEDYPHATGKAVISVSAIGTDGVAGTPVPVLEEPHHLSYPQVFAHAGDVWMLPEGSGSRKLTLYRAERFPNRWVPATVLLEGEMSDATLLQHDGKYWLFATDRDGAGSTSDTLVVFHAPSLTGPWTPHAQNPILIDRRRARPGGALARVGSELLLPIQDGTTGYGGGLGLSRLVRLDEQGIELAEPMPVAAAGDFLYPRIHTLNRAGRLEVIDGIAEVRR